MDVEKIGDDPPARIRAWLATIEDDEVRALDQRLMLDLLTIEKRPDAWSGVLDTAVDDIDQLVLVGDLPLASQLLEAIVKVAKDEAAPFHGAGRGGRDQAGRRADGAPPRDLPAAGHRHGVRRRQADVQDDRPGRWSKPMSDAMMGEDNPRTVRRLRDILISFGPAAREYANELKSSRNPAVRRAAIDLLRAPRRRRGAARSARRCSTTPMRQVQREALRAIVQVGTDEAYQMLEQALKSGARAHARGDHAGARRVPRREGGAAVRPHPQQHRLHGASWKAIYTLGDRIARPGRHRRAIGRRR